MDKALRVMKWAWRRVMLHNALVSLLLLNRDATLVQTVSSLINHNLFFLSHPFNFLMHPLES